MKFKDEICEIEFRSLPEPLLQICVDFERLSEEFGIEPVVTRVKEKVQGSSGVHEAGRAVDFRDEYDKNKFLYPEKVRLEIAQKLNAKYSRRDGKQTCFWHSFKGGRHHFHVQLASRLDVYEGGDSLWA